MNIYIDIIHKESFLLKQNMEKQPSNIQRLTVQQSVLPLKFNTIGFGNPRYNSAVIHNKNLLLSCTSTLRLINLQTSTILWQKQIGSSQIFQVLSSEKYVMTINFEGLVTLLDKNNLEIKHQFKTAGKQVRHSCITEDYISTSSELIKDFDGSILEVFSLKDIQSKNYKPFFERKGHFYYPQIHKDSFIVLEYNDPNPKQKARVDTVLSKKLPITNRIVHFKNYEHLVQIQVPHTAEIICAARNHNWIFYLHNDKFLSIYNTETSQFIEHSCKDVKNVLMAVEAYKNGIIYASSSNIFTILQISQTGEISKTELKVQSTATSSGFCYKILGEQGFYSFNENGLHFYSFPQAKTYSLNLFNITNCGLALSPDNLHIAVGDFGGCIYVYPTDYLTANYQCLYSTFIGMSIRALTWGKKSNQVIIGTMDGGLYVWHFETGEQPQLIHQFPHAINILRTSRQHYIAATSNGDITFFNTSNYSKDLQHKAHTPIHYEQAKDRELFGSMKHYAEIWSLAASPNQEFFISSCSEDQTIKIFKVTKEMQLHELHQLRGHQLAVTSIDWQNMNAKVGEIYVSCSDDKKITFRNPNNNFEVLFTIETSTIKQWHTLTYLALEAGGNRVAIGSQNGYLFIYNIETRMFEFAEKVHLGGIQGLIWGKNNLLITISSDLCINLIEV